MEPPFLSFESTERRARMTSIIHSSDTPTKPPSAFIGLPGRNFWHPSRPPIHRGGDMHETELTTRKNEHLDQDLATLRTRPAVSNGFEAVRFEHCALPQLDLPQVDRTSSLFGKPLAAP